MSKAPLDVDRLRRLIGVVDVILANLPAVDHRRRESFVEYRKAASAALDELGRIEGARWRVTGYEVALRLGGLRASATGGEAAVLRNWRNAATKKIGGVV